MKKALGLAILLTFTLTACDSTAKEAAALAAVTDRVVTASEWSEIYPDQYASYVANSANDVALDHVEEYPMIATVYEGMAFNEFYNTARGHAYTLEDVAATGRPHAFANCLSCKTPDYTFMVNEQGVEAYSLSFDEVFAQTAENVSCYNCHGNTPGELVITHEYLETAMGESGIAPETLSCAQCHVEYYFDPETKATTLPYDCQEAMSPDAILSYYKEMGFTDYENPKTGTKHIKVQHPEFETYMGAGSVHANQFDCAACHMGTVSTGKDEGFTSHTWTSPLDNKDLMANNCAACHTDLAADVKAIQEEAESRTISIGYQLEELTNKLADAVAAGDLDEATLNEIRALNSDAQFYWDFVFVENSEGAHNSALTKDCLDKAQTMVDKALAML